MPELPEEKKVKVTIYIPEALKLRVLRLVTDQSKKQGEFSRAVTEALEHWASHVEDDIAHKPARILKQE